MIPKTQTLFAVLVIMPAMALAEQASRVMLGDARFWVVVLVVQGLAMFAYLASSLSHWARWQDGPLSDRLALVQGWITSMLAGNVAYFGGYYSLEWPEVVAVIAAAAASWGGDKFLSPLMTRLIEKFNKLFS